MLPLAPPSTMFELSTAHTEKTPVPRLNPTYDPDGFLVPDALQPDPVFMGLRALFETGPIGRLRARIDAAIEAREERRYGSPNPSRQTSAPARSAEPPTSLSTGDRQRGDIAA